MGKEINLMKNYPKTKRDLEKRLKEKTADISLVREFGKEFFDGTRSQGYGGYNYNPKFWENVIPTFKEYYNLDENSRILDIGCAKGFMLYDFKRLIPGISIDGIDISEYAITNSMEEVKDNLVVGSAIKLPYEDNSFDLVISIVTLHNLYEDDLKVALQEITRVSKKNAFITLDAYRNNEDKIAIEAWNTTAVTILHTDEWKNMFDEVGYEGDYFWFIP